MLRQVETWAAGLERVPSTAAKLDEEELRDHLLIALNLHWEGRAGAELFNGAGKTDILIRERDHNVSIAVCKFWRGPKSATAALTQLLSYVVWRDSKAALIIFVTTKDPAATIASLHATIEADERFLLRNDRGRPDRRSDYVIRADDEGRTVSVAVTPVVIRPGTQQAIPPPRRHRPTERRSSGIRARGAVSRESGPTTSERQSGPVARG